MQKSYTLKVVNVEQRMNGICAGGTGSFIDQMASLIQTDASGLNEFAKDYKAIYPIVSDAVFLQKQISSPLSTKAQLGRIYQLPFSRLL